MSVVVVGAGLAGISAALTLQDAGVEVEVFESSDIVGGRVATDLVDGFRLDRGFQLINDGYSELQHLDVIDELEFVYAERLVDLVTTSGVKSLGDPRQALSSIFNSSIASFSEKLAFLRFLASKPTPGASLDADIQAAGVGKLYSRVLEPFLTGVFLTSPKNVDAGYGKEIIKSFTQGKSGLPKYGAGTLSQALAARVEVIHTDERIDSLDQFAGRKVIVATDMAGASKLTGAHVDMDWASSTTWYHRIPVDVSRSKRLRIDSDRNGPVINSTVISNSMTEYAPHGSALLSTTTIGSTDEHEVRKQLSTMWAANTANWELIRKYEITHSLPIFKPGHSRIKSSKINDNLFIAGDYLTGGSQNGALLSGRLAAEELLAD
jgi:hypothetical protein